MLYLPERSSLADTAPTGSVLTWNNLPAGTKSGHRHTLHGTKDIDGSSMGRGYKSISTLSIVLRRVPLLVLLCCTVGLVSATAHAQSASTWNKRGQEAEARQNYDAAMDDYHQAMLKSPTDLRYKTRYEHTRFLASVGHVDRGRVLRQSGDMNGALAEFKRALQIDPGNQTAQQEIDQVEQILQNPQAGNGPERTEQMSRQNEIIDTIGSIAGPVQLKPASNDPITIHSVEDVKNIYQAIGKLAGLNVLFDPDYTSKRIPVDLTNVTLSDALRIVGTIAGTFYKAITPNTIFVAQNTRTKRTDLDEQAVQTFYLTNASQQNDANEVVIAIRNLLDPSVKIYLVPSQNAIVMRATPDQLLLAEKLLNDLDRARPEVVVDVAVLEVDRNFERNLGITLPQSVTITPQANPNATATSSSSSSSASGTTNTTSNFTLNSLAHLNANNFAVGITGGTVNALLTDSNTRVLQNPSIRATDGQRATLKIGQKIPIATGSYNAGVSTGVASIGVQTQFTYIDVGVNIDMTPTVHYDHEVTLKLKVEVSSEEPQPVTISGVTEPIIGQRVVEQTIQLKDGEPSLLSGIISTTDSLNIAGTPGLGELPILKYFFSSRDKVANKQEIVFLLIPHIVRESVLSRTNTRAIDTGTGQSIELRRDPSAADRGADGANPLYPKPKIGQATTAANAASAMVQQLSQQAQPIQPPTENAAAAATAANGAMQQLNQQAQPPNPAATAGGPPINFAVAPADSNQSVGATFQVAVMLNNGKDVFSVPLQLKFNSAVLQLVNVDAGDFLGRDGQATSIVHRDDGNGLVAISTNRPPNAAGVSGSGSLCTLTFKAIAPGDANLSLVKVGALNSAQANIPAVGSQAVVHVK
ncbi:cohesin domain-containing protein [Tunturiibacter lichenicola]|uniref:cohesin domain-containing protein n=1 Tax=Tunturiibacter lichenicola TaxID=2051959 RepID=UPI0021B25A1C|nr:cohesin domain-containing protein [Edaphobacter lichenicola]